MPLDRMQLAAWNDSSNHNPVAYPEELRRLEVEELETRREIWSEATQKAPVETGPIGFALSGGGIRSATFSLGLFQALARAGGLPRVDFLSSVSGGGYFGAFLGRMFHNKLSGPDHRRYDLPLPPEAKDAWGSPARAARECAEALASSDSAELRWLRDNGRYLAPGGSGDLWLGGATVVRNWAAVLYVLGLGALTALLVARLPWLAVPSSWVETVLQPLDHIGRGLMVWSPWVWAPLLVLALLCFPFAWVYFLVFPRRVQGVARYVPPGTARAAVISTAAVGLLAVVLGPALTAALETKWLSGIRGVAGALDALRKLVPLLLTLQGLGWALFAACLIAAFTWLYAWRRFGFLSLAGPRGGKTEPGPQRSVTTQARLDEAHGWLDRKLSRTLVALAALAGLAVIDTAGGTIYAHLHSSPKLLWSGLTAVVSVLAGLVTFGSRVATLLSDGKRSARLTLPWKALASVGAIAVLAILLIALSTLAHGLCWGFHAPDLPTTTAAGPPVFELRTVAGGEIRVAAIDSERPFEGAGRKTPGLAAAAAGAMLLLSWLLGRIIPFLNYSSLHSLYSGRLARAYLGASNPDRQTAPVLKDHPGDDLPMASYRPAVAGGPIHLVNVTINETVSPKTGLSAGDQRGLGMSVSPNAMSVGIRHHVLRPLPGQTTQFLSRTAETQAEVRTFPRRGFRVFEYRVPLGGAESEPYRGEPLTLAQWVGISGAAFSTGIGSKTSVGVSLLCGLANVRLGYWWDSGIDPERRQAIAWISRWRRRGRGLADRLPVHAHLLDEWLARFHGINRRRWNLSDGGHFNNLGAYELVRRRLPLIVAVDTEADPNNTFDALTDLIRRIRVDFGAETRFLNRAEMEPLLEGAPAEWRHVIGELSDLGRVPPEKGAAAARPDQPTPQDLWRHAEPESRRRSAAHATLAEIVYPGRTTVRPSPARSLMLYVKASLTGDERADILQYQQSHPDFPHETTADQFFDDAQWESYRKLGEHVGTLLFNRPSHLAAGSTVLPELLAPLEWLW